MGKQVAHPTNSKFKISMVEIRNGGPQFIQSLALMAWQLKWVEWGCAGALIWRICANEKVSIFDKKWLKSVKFLQKVLKSGWVLGWF